VVQYRGRSGEASGPRNFPQHRQALNVDQQFS
jgi:hypothetical protein